MKLIGDLAVPIVIGVIVLAGMVKKAAPFDAFLSGAGEGLTSLIKIIPSLVGLITAVEMLKASGALDVICCALAPVANFLGVPNDVMPLALLRPISGGGSIALLQSVLNSAGPDSLVGRTASVICGSSETTFYTIAVYYGGCGISKTRYTLCAALIGDLAAVIISSFIVKIFYC